MTFAILRGFPFADRPFGGPLPHVDGMQPRAWPVRQTRAGVGAKCSGQHVYAGRILMHRRHRTWVLDNRAQLSHLPPNLT